MSVSGKSVCVTGKMEIKRSLAEAQLTELGATVKSGVTKNVDILFVGTDAGSKLAKAEALGIEIIDEEGLMTILSGGGAKAASKAKAVVKKAKDAKEAKVTKAKSLAKGKVTSVSGKNVCVTGKMGIKRKEAELKLTALGATVRGSVSKNVDILFVGTDAGSKLDKAESLGISIVDEAGLMKVLGE